MNGKELAGMIVGVMLIILFAGTFLMSSIPWTDSVPVISDLGIILWGIRSYEVILQGFIILSGVIAILLLLRSSREVHP